MSESIFKFKQFVVNQEFTAMKIGTDGVLIGSAAEVDNCKKIIDIGTGTGFIALACAQRNFNAEIFAIEIEKNAYNQAVENFKNSKFSNRIFPIFDDFRRWNLNNKQTFDCAVSNPPFYTNNLKSVNYERNLARSEDFLRFNDLIIGVENILKIGGIFSVIIPYCEFENFTNICEKHNLFLFKKTEISTVEGKNPSRVIVCYSKCYKKSFTVNKLTIRLKNGNYSPEYINLTKDFYLNF